ncbi:MAG: ATP-binding cassette domain-containing protein [Lachnospiraceae bacterium]
MIYIDNLTKVYGKYLAVNKLNLHVPKGDLFGFVGPNGAGKTTTIRMLCGLLKPTYGLITISGHDIVYSPDQYKKSIGYVPDFFGVYDNLKVKEYMEFYGSIYGIDDRTVAKMTGDLLELVNLKNLEEQYVDTLSRGMKQRLCVARALLHNPDLLIMDEPSSGLDPRARVEMKEVLLNLNSMGKTIIISSHILSDIAEMCNSVGIMNRGCLVTAGRMKDILSIGVDKHHLIINVKSNMDEAISHVKELPEVSINSVMENEIVINCGGSDEEVNKIIMSLMQAGVLIGGFRKEEQNLETLFMQLTSQVPGTVQAPLGMQPGPMAGPVNPGMQPGPMAGPVNPGMQPGPMAGPVNPGMQFGPAFGPGNASAQPEPLPELDFLKEKKEQENKPAEEKSFEEQAKEEKSSEAESNTEGGENI